MAEQFQPDGDYEERVRDSFARQEVMRTLGASLTNVTPGIVEIEMDYRSSLTQQHGYLHAGVISTALDSACGYAAYSLMPADAAVLTSPISALSTNITVTVWPSTGTLLFRSLATSGRNGLSAALFSVPRNDDMARAAMMVRAELACSIPSPAAISTTGTSSKSRCGRRPGFCKSAGPTGTTSRMSTWRSRSDS